MKKQLIMLFTLLAFSTALWANGQNEEVVEEGGIAKIKLTYAELNPDGHPMADIAYYFAEQVKEISGGKMTIEVYTSGILGSGKENLQSLQTGGGSVDLYRGNTNELSDYNCKKLSLFGMPYTFRDREHLWNVIESEIGLEYLKEPQEAGTNMVGLFYTEEGARNFFTTDAIKDMASMKGLKLRVPKTEVMSDTVKALGVEPTPIDWGELYNSLQTGVVDGAEQPLAGYYNNKFYEVAPYYILDGHTYSPGIVLMAEAVWNKLSEAQQNVLVEAGNATQQFNKSNAAKVDRETLIKIREVANVIEVADASPWQNATAPVIAKYIAGLETEMDAIKSK